MDESDKNPTENFEFSIHMKQQKIYVKEEKKENIVFKFVKKLIFRNIPFILNSNAAFNLLIEYFLGGTKN